jgi:hypothetical protein
MLLFNFLSLKIHFKNFYHFAITLFSQKIELRALKNTFKFAFVHQALFSFPKKIQKVQKYHSSRSLFSKKIQNYHSPSSLFPKKIQKHQILEPSRTKFSTQNITLKQLGDHLQTDFYWLAPTRSLIYYSTQ